MAQSDDKGIFSFTAPATSTFLNLLEPKAVQRNGKDTGEPKYSANLELPPDHADLARFKARCAEIARARWPNRDLKDLAFPITSGDKLADKAKERGKDREFSRGKVVVTARSKFQPRMSIMDGGKIVDLEDAAAIQAHSRKFYSGCQVLAQVNLVAYEGVGNNPDGVCAYLNMVLSLNKGEKLTGGGASAAEVFSQYVGSAADYDPTGGVGLDDEIQL